MVDHRRPLTDSPFDTLEATFDLLVSGPRPLALCARELAGLPDRPVPLGELKARLLHPSTPYAVRDAIVGALVALAKREGGAWTVGVAGVLLPGLRRAIWPLTRAYPERAHDVEAEALAAFLGALGRARPGRAHLSAWLCWHARNGAKRVLNAELAERGRPGTDPVSAAPPRPWGHPDFVLRRAVAAEVIKAADAELIARTRLDGEDIGEIARRLGLDYETVRSRRGRAEAKLRRYLTSDWYLPFDFVGKGAVPPCSLGEGRPRQEKRGGRQPGKRHLHPEQRR